MTEVIGTEALTIIEEIELLLSCADLDNKAMMVKILQDILKRDKITYVTQPLGRRISYVKPEAVDFTGGPPEFYRGYVD